MRRVVLIVALLVAGISALRIHKSAAPAGDPGPAGNHVRANGKASEPEITFDASALDDLVEPVDPERGCGGQAKFANGFPVAFAFLVFRLKSVDPIVPERLSDHWFVSTVTDADGRFSLTLPRPQPFTGAVMAVDARAKGDPGRWETSIPAARPGEPLTLSFQNDASLEADVSVAIRDLATSGLQLKLMLKSAVAGEQQVAQRWIHGSERIGFGELGPGEYRLIVDTPFVSHWRWDETVTLGGDAPGHSRVVNLKIPDQPCGTVEVRAVEADGTTAARWGSALVEGLPIPYRQVHFHDGMATLKHVPAGHQTIVVRIHECAPVKVTCEVIPNAVNILLPIRGERAPQRSVIAYKTPDVSSKAPAEWLRQFQEGTSDGGHAERAEAAEALKRLGLQYRDGVAALVAGLDDPDKMTRFHAAGVLASFGPDLENVADDWLIDALRHSSDIGSHELGMGQHLGMLLQGLRHAAVPVLMVCVCDSNRNAREYAVAVLGNMGPVAKPSVPLLRLIMANRHDSHLRARAAGAYAKITADSPDAVEILIQSLRLPISQSGIWCDAANTLAALGADARPAIPALVEMLNGEHEGMENVQIYRGPPPPLFNVRAEAADALGRIGSAAKDAVPALMQAARIQDPGPMFSAERLRRSAAHALFRIDPQNPEAKPPTRD